MFPAPRCVWKVKDFNKEEYKYKRLLMTELKFCNDNADKVILKANRVYKIGTNPKHPLSIHCCDFKLLDSLVTHKFPLEKVADGIVFMRDSKENKIKGIVVID
jgi:protein AbiQ